MVDYKAWSFDSFAAAWPFDFQIAAKSSCPPNAAIACYSATVGTAFEFGGC